MKLFGLGPNLLKRYQTLGETFYEEDKRLAVKRAVWAYSLSLLGTVAFYGCYGAMALSTALGKLTVPADLGDSLLDGGLVLERRLVVRAGASVAHDLKAYGLRGAFSLELVGDEGVSATIVRTGRFTKEIRR